jgi:hypothetical protein
MFLYNIIRMFISTTDKDVIDLMEKGLLDENDNYASLQHVIVVNN